MADNCLSPRRPVPKRHDRLGRDAAEWVEEFNRQFPVGSTVWYWKTLPRGPVVETTIREPAFVADSGFAVVFLAGVSGYVFLTHVLPPNEEQRPHVEFV